MLLHYGCMMRTTFQIFNYKAFDKFIEVVGPHGQGMKPPAFHEVLELLT